MVMCAWKAVSILKRRAAKSAANSKTSPAFAGVLLVHLAFSLRSDGFDEEGCAIKFPPGGVGCLRNERERLSWLFFDLAKLERAGEDVRYSQVQSLKARRYHSDAAAASDESEDIMKTPTAVEKCSAMVIGDIISKCDVER